MYSDVRRNLSSACYPEAYRYNQTVRFVRSDLPVSPWDVVDMDGVPVENHESEEASGMEKQA